MSDVDIVDVFKGSSLWLTQAIISSSSSFELFFGVSSISNGEVVTICGSFSVGGPLVLSPMLICGLSGGVWSALGTSSLAGIVSSGFCPSLWIECVFLPSLPVSTSTIWMGS